MRYNLSTQGGNSSQWSSRRPRTTRCARCAEYPPATLCATVGIVVSAAHERVENAASQNWNLIEQHIEKLRFNKQDWDRDKEILYGPNPRL